MNANELADLMMVFDSSQVWEHAEEIATMLRNQQKYINRLHKLCNANGIGVGRNLLTGEVIPFEVNDE